MKAYSIITNACGDYLGTVFIDADCRYSHSILNHGSPSFATAAEAKADFLATKVRLPAHVHGFIFGNLAA